MNSKCVFCMSLTLRSLRGLKYSTPLASFTTFPSSVISSIIIWSASLPHCLRVAMQTHTSLILFTCSWTEHAHVVHTCQSTYDRPVIWALYSHSDSLTLSVKWQMFYLSCSCVFTHAAHVESPEGRSWWSHDQCAAVEEVEKANGSERRLQFLFC